MKTIFVNLKSEVTSAMVEYFLNGCDTYRVRLSCNCEHGHNRRSGVLAIQGDTVVCKIIRCKGCAKQAESEFRSPEGKEASL
jgi:hypothetical protein